MSDSSSIAQIAIVGVIAGLVLGAIVALLVSRGRHQAERAAALADQAQRLGEAQSVVQSQLSAAQAALARADAETRQLRGEAERERSDARAREQALGQQHAALQVEAEALRQQLSTAQAAVVERQAFIERAHETLGHQFKTLAGDILESHSKRFSEQNQQNLGGMLEPLRERLGTFQQKVETLYIDESKERSALKTQVQELMQLNRTLSDDAQELAQALRGSAKRLGNWGELVLERVLETAGLRRGHEYLVQDSRVDEQGQRRQPDVVIQLPEGRCLVVDSKVSLIAYDRYVSADDDASREAALRDHLISLRAHIKGLSDKRYQALYGNTLDFVLMFVPVEPAFMTAVSHDERLFTEAWESNVLLVSPSTLLFVVRTVAHLWRQEARSRNAQDIAKRGAELYDRLSGFVEKLDEVGSRLNAAQLAWTDARKKLAEGRGNVIRQAEMLRELGVQPARQLPADLIDRAMTDSALEPPVPPPTTPPHSTALPQG